MSKKKGKRVQEIDNSPVFRIITLGDSGVGKTSIINRYVKNIFNDNNPSTVGVSFAIKELYINKQKIRLKLIDTCGQERYKALTNAYLKNTDACFFIFALNDRDSFDNIKMWMDLFYQNHKINEIPSILIGNKSDLESDIEDNIINEFAQNTNIEFIKTSAKEKININEVMEKLAKILYKKSNFSDKQNINNIMISEKNPKKKKKCMSWIGGFLRDDN